MSGSFSVDGVLNNGTLCCIEGDVSDVAFEEGNGWGVSLDLGSIELGLTGFSNIQGKATSQVENCIDGLTPFNEVAEIDVTTEWLVQLFARGAVLSYRLGPLELESGLLASIFGTQIEVGSGRSASATFTVDEHTTSYGAAIGAFVSVSASLGAVQIKTVVDGLISGWGKDSHFENVPLVSAGIVLGF
jgi:hypothetical protein